MLGKRLIKLRNDKGLTQGKLADMLSMSRSTYAQYEIDRRQPDYQTLTKFADFFNVSTDYLLGRSDVEKINQPDFSEAFKEKNLGDAILRIVNMCAEFGLSNETRMEMIDKAVKKYGLPGGPNCGAGDEAAHGPKKPGSGVLDNE